MTYDLVIRNGTVVDGSGLAPFPADVGVVGDRIAAVGRIRERGAREIDAEGLVVTPGFIDGHTHMDAQVFWDERGSCSCYHGVTTVVMGHCGFTLAPAPPDQRALVVRNLERAEDISGAAMAAGIEWTWTTFAEYLDAVDRRPKAINYVANIGHSALRTYAMGERAFTEEATNDDLEVMATELAAALRAGAYGFTTSRTRQHETSDDRPVASRLASWDEVRALVEVMGDAGGGVFQLVEDRHEAPDGGEEMIRRLIELGVDTGVSIAIPAGGNDTRVLGILDEAAAAGAHMFGLSHCRGIGNMSSFRSRLPFDSLPEWREMRARPLPEQRRLLEDPAVRERLVKIAADGDFGRAIGAEARKPDYERMRVLDAPLPPNPTVADVARQRNVDPVEAIIELSLESDFERFFVQTIAPFDADRVRTVMKHPRTVMAFSDAGAHVSQMSDCSIYTHLLSHWVRDRQDFTLEEAVRMITFEPARAWNFADRGLVREGLVADLNVLDPQTLAPEMPHLVNDLPAGARRIEQFATGFVATLVGGQVTFEDHADTGARPGRLLRGRLATATAS
jgi:N-acyl-D-aspartate/D-glutamate deacylase